MNKRFLLNYLGAFGASAAIVLVLAFGNFWPSAKLDAKNLPIGVVSLDSGVDFPSKINIGANILELVNKNSSNAVNWLTYDTEKAAINAVDNKAIYAYVIIPKNFSSAILSHISKNTEAPAINIYLNEGMNYSGVTAAEKITEVFTSKINSSLQVQLLGMLSKNQASIASAFVKNIMKPFTVNTSKMHSIGKGASGIIPLMLSVFLWMGSLISALLIWRVTVYKTSHRKLSVPVQILSGLGVSIILPILDLVLVNNAMGLEINHYLGVYLFSVVIGFTFFLLQSNILNWIGMKGWPLLILIWIFGMPAVSVPYEFLNNFTKYFVYSWSPYRFSSEMFRDVMYYDYNADFSALTAIILISGITLLVLLGLSILKKSKKSKKELAAA